MLEEGFRNGVGDFFGALAPLRGLEAAELPAELRELRLELAQPHLALQLPVQLPVQLTAQINCTDEL